MRRFRLRLLIFLLPLFCLAAFAQENTVVRVGVLPMRGAPNTISAPEARDRILNFLNRQKADKKLKSKIEAVAVEGTTPAEVLADARQKKCEFVLATQLTELTSSEKFTASGVTIGAEYAPVYYATVGYRMTRVVDGADVAISSARSEDGHSKDEAVQQALNQIVTKTVSTLKTRSPLDEAAVAKAAQEAQQKQEASPKPAEPNEIAADYCAWLPNDISHASALHGVCEFAVSLPQKMPNFICQTDTSRYRGENKVPNDLITASVRYQDGRETFSDIKFNGKAAPDAIAATPGLWSTGEFGGDLRAIFNLHNNPIFEFSGENRVGDYTAWVFKYSIAKQDEPLWRLHAGAEMLAPPYGGELWIDEATGAVLRFNAAAKNIPKDFAIQNAELLTEYDNVVFGDGSSFVLPTSASVSTKFRGEKSTRNVVQFRSCHKFRATVQMVLNVPAETGAANADIESAATLQIELDRNREIFAILTDHVAHDADAYLEAEQATELNAANAATIHEFAKLIHNAEIAKLATRQVEASTLSGPITAEPVTTLKTSVSVVLVPVVLRDAHGRALGHLRKEDFQLFDDRKPQAITSFSVLEKEKVKAEDSSTDGKPAAPATAFATRGATATLPTRSVALIFDDIHASFSDLVSARDAALKYLANLGPEDRVAVFVTSGQLGIDFTSDRDKLRETTQNLKPHPVLQPSKCPQMSRYMADLIVNHDDRDALMMATNDAFSCAFQRMGTHEKSLAENMARQAAHAVADAASSEAQSALGVMRLVIRSTALQPGRRSIVLVSPGFLSQTPEVQQTMMELADEAVRSDIVINTLDVRGLYTADLGANSNHVSQRERVQFGGEEAAAQSEMLNEIAEDTGGIYFHNNNDLSEGFRRTAEAPEYVYLLGFSPLKFDGKFHKLKVTVNAQLKASVQARKGYFAAKAAAPQ